MCRRLIADHALDVARAYKVRLMGAGMEWISQGAGNWVLPMRRIRMTTDKPADAICTEVLQYKLHGAAYNALGDGLLLTSVRVIWDDYGHPCVTLTYDKI